MAAAATATCRRRSTPAAHRAGACAARGRCAAPGMPTSCAAAFGIVEARQARGARQHAFGAIAQRVDVVEEGRQLGAADRVARFLGEEIGGIAREILRYAAAGAQALAQR